jgi:heme oxygenase
MAHTLALCAGRLDPGRPTDHPRPARRPLAAPADLTYFDPYPAQAGTMWRDLRSALTEASSATADEGIEAGACGAFAVLERWLAG